MLDLAFTVALSFINQHIPCLCTGVCVGVLMGMYEWIATIDRSLQQLWAVIARVVKCNENEGWNLELDPEHQGRPGRRLKGEWRVQSAQEGEQFSQLCFRFAWGDWVQKQGSQSGRLLESARGRGMDFNELEQVRLYTWGRTRTGLWICGHQATKAGLRKVTGWEGKDHSQSSFSPHLSQSSCPFLSDRCSLLFRGICHLEWKCTSSAYSS